MMVLNIVIDVFILIIEFLFRVIGKRIFNLCLSSALFFFCWCDQPKLVFGQTKLPAIVRIDSSFQGIFVLLIYNWFNNDYRLFTVPVCPALGLGCVKPATSCSSFTVIHAALRRTKFSPTVEIKMATWSARDLFSGPASACNWAVFRNTCNWFNISVQLSLYKVSEGKKMYQYNITK